MTEQEFEAGLKAEGFETITTVTKEPGYAMGDHAHPFDACALITTGSITLDVGGAITTYSAGDIFRLAAGTPHTEGAGPQGVSYRVGRRGAAA
jgi:quercetin dioxygenase-like cupin family protein